MNGHFYCHIFTSSDQEIVAMAFIVVFIMSPDQEIIATIVAK